MYIVKKIYGLALENWELITLMSSEDSDESAQMCSITRPFASWLHSPGMNVEEGQAKN